MWKLILNELKVNTAKRVNKNLWNEQKICDAKTLIMQSFSWILFAIFLQSKFSKMDLSNYIDLTRNFNLSINKQEKKPQPEIIENNQVML